MFGSQFEVRDSIGETKVFLDQTNGSVISFEGRPISEFAIRRRRGQVAVQFNGTGDAFPVGQTFIWTPKSCNSLTIIGSAGSLADIVVNFELVEV